MALADVVGSSPTWRGTGAVYPLGEARAWWSPDGSKVVLSDSGCTFASVGCDATRVVDAKTGRTLWTVRGYTYDVNWSPNGQIAAFLEDIVYVSQSSCSYQRGTVKVRTLDSGNALGSVEAAPHLYASSVDILCSTLDPVYWPSLAWQEEGSRFAVYEVSRASHTYPEIGELSVFEVSAQGVNRVPDAYDVSALKFNDIWRYTPAKILGFHLGNLYYKVGGNAQGDYQDRIYEIKPTGEKSIAYLGSNRCGTDFKNIEFVGQKVRFSEECYDNTISNVRIIEVDLVTRQVNYRSPVIPLGNGYFDTRVIGIDWQKQLISTAKWTYPTLMRTFSFSGSMLNSFDSPGGGSYWMQNSLLFVSEGYVAESRTLNLIRYGALDSPQPVRTQWSVPPTRIDYCANGFSLFLNPQKNDQVLLSMPSRLIADPRDSSNGGCWNKTNEGGIFTLDTRSFSSVFTIPSPTETTHLSNAYTATAQPNGTLIASGGRDSSVKLWDRASGRLQTTLAGHSDAVYTVAWRPDGARLATGGGDGRIVLWNPSGAGSTESTLLGHKYTVRDLAWSFDGSRLASASWDRTARIWNPATGESLFTLDHADLVNAVAFSPNGALLATASSDRTVKLWNVTTGALLRTLSESTDSVFALAFSPSGTTLATAGADKDIRLYDPNTGALQRTIQAHYAPIRALSWLTDGVTVISGGLDNTVRAWDTSSGKERFTVTPTGYPVMDLEPVGTTKLLTATADGSVAMFNLKFDLAPFQSVAVGYPQSNLTGVAYTVELLRNETQVYARLNVANSTSQALQQTYTLKITKPDQTLLDNGQDFGEPVPATATRDFRTNVVNSSTPVCISVDVKAQYTKISLPLKCEP